MRPSLIWCPPTGDVRLFHLGLAIRQRARRRAASYGAMLMTCAYLRHSSNRSDMFQRIQGKLRDSVKPDLVEL
jgi:hypothetical protein